MVRPGIFLGASWNGIPVSMDGDGRSPFLPVHRNMPKNRNYIWADGRRLRRLFPTACTFPRCL